LSLTVFESINDVRSWVREAKAHGATVGFVPTMGALHHGHISLIERAKEQCEKVVVSIFVNPTQFNNPEDLKKYPRHLEQDSAMLAAAGCDVLFHPSVLEMYPKPGQKKHWDFGPVSKTLEGEFRPGHFDGVLTIVQKLFEAVEPDMAFFGEKDFQQLTLIKKMTIQEKLPVEVVACPSIRESTGLAMSSRNMRLSKEEYQNAHAISRTLFFMKENQALYTPGELENKGQQMLASSPGVQMEYLRIVDSETFLPLREWNVEVKPVVLVAAFVGEVRLIDNIIL
jgi:pantoate--beta-alanine ligase